MGYSFVLVVKWKFEFLIVLGKLVWRNCVLVKIRTHIMIFVVH